MADQSPEKEGVLGEEEAVALLTGGPEGIAEWNRIVGEGTTELPSLEEASLAHRDLTGANLAPTQIHLEGLGGSSRGRGSDRSALMAARGVVG